MIGLMKRVVQIALRPSSAVNWLMNCRGFRKLFMYYLYRGSISHSETAIALMRNSCDLDETYWIGKLRQFAHVVDKGLHRGDFSKGHGVSGYKAAKKALSRIHTREGLDDRVVRWAIERVRLYEKVQDKRISRLICTYVPTTCKYEDLLDAIRSRRSIRSYTHRPVTDDVVERIGSVLDWAPTSCHRQPGRVWASTNPEIIRRCVKLHVGASCFTDIHVPLFLTFGADSRLYKMPGELAVPYIDVALGVQNCLLVAHTLGISLTPLIWSHQGEQEEYELRRILSIPRHFAIIVSAVGGYPSEGAQVPPRKPTELFIRR